MKRHPLAVLAIVYASVAVAQAQSPLTPQLCQDTIRQAYAKLMFANQVGVIEKYLFWQKLSYPGAVLSQVLKDNELTFELSNFKEGSIASSRAPFSELATYMGGKPTLTIQGQHNTFKTEDVQDSEENAALVQESVGQVVEGADRFVVSDLNTLANPADPKWSKYLSYNVVATYKGKKTAYRATFVFNDAGSASFLDPFVPGITNYAVLSVYPEVLLKHLNDNHDVMEWARANSTKETPSKQMLCDPKTLKCLIPAADIVDKSKPQQAGLESGAPLRPN